MKTSRLSPLVVAIIGIVLCLLAVVGIVFFLIKPTQDQITVQQARLDLNAPGTTYESRLQGLQAANTAAQKGLKAAVFQVLLIKSQWGQREAQLMPPFNVGGTLPADRFRAQRQLTYELLHYLGPDLERQLKTGPVTPTTKFALPPPPVNPNDITSAPIVILLGAVTVNGDFRRILTHFYDWQYFNRLVDVDSLALHGSSPYMQGTYTATLYIFPQGDDKLAPTIPQAGAGAGSGSAPGGRPGGSGGYPGGQPFGGRR